MSQTVEIAGRIEYDPVPYVKTYLEIVRGTDAQRLMKSWYVAKLGVAPDRIQPDQIDINTGQLSFALLQLQVDSGPLSPHLLACTNEYRAEVGLDVVRDAIWGGVATDDQLEAVLGLVEEHVNTTRYIDVPPEKQYGQRDIGHRLYVLSRKILSGKLDSYLTSQQQIEALRKIAFAAEKVKRPWLQRKTLREAARLAFKGVTGPEELLSEFIAGPDTDEAADSSEQ